MWKIPILKKYRALTGERAQRSGACYALVRPLPVCYMAEYSVVGLLVDGVDEAIRVLAENKFSVHDETGDLEVIIDEPGVLPKIVRLLAENGIASELADVVSGIYQG
jgi:hypothetical protein